MLTVNLFRDFRVLIILSVFAMSCECCCECKDMSVATVTLNISLPATYPGRTCAIPVTGGDFTSVAGDNILTFLGGSVDRAKYVLYAEVESCCGADFSSTAEFQELVQAGTANGGQGSGNTPWIFRYALNTTAGNASPTIPIPKSSEVPTIKIIYWEPCITGGSADPCESPSPCSLYRPRYETAFSVVFPNGSSSVTLPANLMHTTSACGITGQCGN